jgi:hypothetical protein
MKKEKKQVELPNGMKIEITLEPSAGSKYVRMKSISDIRATNLGYTEAIPTEAALNLVAIKLMREKALFFEKNKQPKGKRAADPEILSLTQDVFDELVTSSVESINVLRQKVKDGGVSDTCIQRELFDEALLLIAPRVEAQMTKKFWLEMEDGKQALENAEAAFDSICAKLKLPRRTRAIMAAKAKKEEGNIG